MRGMAWAGNVNGATLRELGWRGAPRDGPHFLSQGGKSRFQQLFSARDDIAPPPPPCHHLETFWVPQLKGHGWHLVDGRGSRSVCRAQNKTPSQEKSGPVVQRLRKLKPETERDPKREEGAGGEVQ